MLEGIRRAIGGAIQKVADFVIPDAAQPQPKMQKDSLRVSQTARAAAGQPEQLPVLPSCGTAPAAATTPAAATPATPAAASPAAPAQPITVADGVYRPGTPAPAEGLVYEKPADDDGVADGVMVLYRPGRESGRNGAKPLQVADNTTGNSNGRGLNQPSPGVWA